MHLSKQNTFGLALLLGSVVALMPLSIDMYLPAFSAIGAHFDTRQSQIELSLTVYFIGVALGQLIYGPLADRYGRRLPMIIGLAIAAAMSVACALAPTIETLIVARFFQAFGMCAGGVISRAIIRDMYEPVDVAKFFSLLMLVMGVAPILAPIFGAQLSLHFGWESIFLLIAAVCVIDILSVSLLLPETHEPNPGVRLSSTFSTYRDILRDRHFVGYSMAGGAAFSSMFAYITGSAFVLIDYYGVAPEHFGYYFGANALGFIVMSQVNRVLLRHFSYKVIFHTALKVLLAAGVALAVGGIASVPLPLFLIPLFVFIACLGVISPNGMAGALEGEARRAGAASALAGSLQFSLSFVFSGAVGVIHAATPLPMCLIMLSGALIANLFARMTRGPARKAP
ncbi:Bcr/CflA family multidrug efflux MFS transporter [Kordiimonas aestuarii]|uniref:Bcr/CflA family multidrug efflux MFS transporter n=1 Tax=Kordiimonas aestuarii TaxID=1005925 RepID=UPI0021D072F3|nr:Bcr/CflA family multidrug efflux MFS transporter [Kordiimonas aestuarii]